MTTTREERRRKWKRAIRDAIAVLRGDNALERLDCTVLGLRSLPQDVQSCLVEAVGAVQDEHLLRIGAAAVAFLEDMLEQMERDRK